MSARRPERDPAPPAPFGRSANEEGTRLDAERELAWVRRTEQAHLLGAAAVLRGTRAQSTDLLFRPVFLPTSLGDWRRRTARVLELLLASDRESSTFPPDEAEARARRRLARLAATPIATWPDPVALASLAFELRVDETTHLALGHARLCVGDARAALEVFLELLRNELRPRWRAATLEGLAAAQARLGRPLLALGAFDQAADDPGSSPLALVGALSFALWLGDAPRARRAAARLDLLVDPGRPDFRSALERMRDFALGTRDRSLAGSTRAGDDRPKAFAAASGDLWHALADAPASPAGQVLAALT